MHDELMFWLNEEKEYKNNDADYVVEGYFEISRFSKITSFYRSRYFRRLESKYSFLHRIDIQNCFDHLYTHSIDWAYVGDKDVAKELQKYDERVSSLLDKVMQMSNYRETNGIVVGPEFSRWVAEIVLMRVDVTVLKDLERQGLIQKHHYEVARYVDDIFIFGIDESTCHKVRLEYERVLRLFKMELNESKIQLEKRPFLRARSWVPSVRAVVREFFGSLNDLLARLRGAEVANKNWQYKLLSRLHSGFIESLRGFIISHGDQTDHIVSYVYSSFRTRFEEVFSIMQKCDRNIQLYLLSALVDLLHSTLSYSITAQHVIDYVRFMTKLYKYAATQDMQHVLNLIYKKSYELLKYNSHYNQELLNLLIFMRRFKKDLPEEVLLSYTKVDDGYFTLSCLAFYISSYDRVYRYKAVRELINGRIYQLACAVVEKYLDGKPSEKEAYKNGRDFLLSVHFYPLHDFFGHRILTTATQHKLDEIKQWLNLVRWPTDKDKLLMLFIEYAKEFDKPFMQFSLTDNDIEPLIVRRSGYTKFGVYE
ncbi:RNA-directed DNA polymerase [Alicyclobacillus sp. ALC3]|uniref:RNA-directed DNA polymerase n=1 Tax=Alicyclobacillus sp. ALC3 TaxID=2796143 RepID=UPI0023794C3B|nr:RNA-directed DNA polymerase [Alicyclobacillus sp. ALC3]WDL99108.1 RNA-directed DNA polymerase [Alicyclobacillus sp. ALC3]